MAQNAGLAPAPETPLKRALRLVHRQHLKLPNNPVDEQWLTNQPVLRLRALHQIRRDIDQAVHEERVILARLAPGSDGHRAAKAGHAKRCTEYAATRHWLRAEIEDAKVLAGPEPVPGYLIGGDLCDVFLNIAAKVAAGETTAAYEQLLAWADKCADQETYGTKEALRAELGDVAA